MKSQRNIVILGASWAGISCAHYILKFIIPAMKNEDCHVCLVGPDEHFYFNIGSPRAAVSLEQMPNSKTFLPIADGFKQYGPESFTFLQGLASSVDFSLRSVTITRTDKNALNRIETLPFYSLIITTGVTTASPLFALAPTSSETQNSLEDMNKRLATAESILIAGGGATGVETAGEVAEILHEAGRNPRIELYSGRDRVLMELRPALSKKADTQLQSLGVDIVHNVKIMSGVVDSDGRTKLHFSDGTSKMVDVYIPCIGVTPNTSFLPRNLLNERGYVANNHKTLRVDNAGARIYALGDVGSHSYGGIFDAQAAVVTAMSNMKRDMILASSPESSPPAAAGEDKIWKTSESETALITLGKDKGVGVAKGVPLPGLFVSKIKGKTYIVETAPTVLKGLRYRKEGKFAFWVR